MLSTAIQENFGIAVVEAVRYGCFPLLPKRLSYPEILPEHLHPLCLYEDEEDLYRKLGSLLQKQWESPLQNPQLRHELASAMTRFSWNRTIGAYDQELTALMS